MAPNLYIMVAFTLASIHFVWGLFLMMTAPHWKSTWNKFYAGTSFTIFVFIVGIYYDKA